MAIIWHDYADKSENVNHWGLSWWPMAAPHLAAAPPALAGALIDNSPISFVTWSISGAAPADLLSPWRGCLTLLTRL